MKHSVRYLLLGLLSLLSAGACAAGVVEDWNEAFLQAVRKEAPPPCLVSRNLPIFHLAIHRAVQDSIKAGLTEPQQERAAAHAANAVFGVFFPSQTHLVQHLQGSRGTTLASIGTAAKPPPMPWLPIAEAAVRRTLKERENDGATTTVHYVPNGKPGQWRRTPPNFRPPEIPHWGKVRPFVLPDVAAFRAPPPPALDSEAYAAEVNLVKEMGGKSSTRRTAEQTLIAHFWSDFSYTTSPAGHWNDIARAISRQRGSKVAEAARLFAVLDVTLADACIAIWDGKYHYNFWRPVTAIQRADEDGTALTTADPAWEPLLRTPPHPEYVSGHSGISGAAAAILEHFFGSKDIVFEAESDDVKDVKRRFTSFQTCAEEIAQSRIYGGIHFPAAGREGLKMGRRIAEAVLKTFPE